MTESSRTPRRAARALFVLALILPILGPLPAAAQDVFSRDSESAVLLRDAKRVAAVVVTVEVRFLTVGDDFLERVGVDFSGAVEGQVANNDRPVENAKLIVELFKVQNMASDPSKETVTRIGRQKVATDSSGRFRVPMRDLVDGASRKEIQDGEVASLRIEVTGKNGKKVDLVRVEASTNLGGLIQ